MRLSASAQVAGPASTPSSYGATSEADGKFLFEDVEPGTYTLFAERTGFVAQVYGARPSGMGGSTLKLDAGQHVKDLVLKLTPQGMIYGKVTDEDGDPVPNASVQALRLSFSRGKRQLQPREYSQVQADGTFVIGNLAAGRYYLSATNDRANYTGMVERPGRKGPEEGYVTTYFPNAVDAAAAAPIEIAAGAELRGIEIRLRKARVFHIRGKVVNTLTGAVPQNMTLMLAPKDADFLLNGPASTVVRGNGGSFEFNRVLPGAYIIRPNDRMRGTSPLTGRTIVNVGDENLDNVVVLLSSGADITGTITLEGGASQQTDPATPPVLPNVMLRLVEGVAFTNNRAQSKDDGTFELHSLAPDVYRVNITHYPLDRTLSQFGSATRM